MSTDTKHQTGGNPLDQLVGLAKSSSGPEAVELIKQALDANGVYTFTELIEVPSIQEVYNVYYCQVHGDRFDSPHVHT